MQKVHQERKKELVSSFLVLLEHLQLTNTADVLAEEAGLRKDKNVEEDISEIMKERHVSESQRRNAVAQYCKYSIQNYLREGKVDEALQIYEVFVPVHCAEKIPEFSLLFAQSYENDHKGIAMLVESLLEKPNVLPQSRVSCINLNCQIWFMQLLGNSILLIDSNSNAIIINSNQITHRKDNIHSDKVNSVSVGPGEVFASGGRDKLVKVWDNTLKLLHTIDLHRARINAVLFFERSLIIFDHDAIISLHRLENNTKTAFKTATPFVDAKYAKGKKRILGVTNEGGSGHINLVNVDKKRIEKLIRTQRKIYAIEISIDEKMIFANMAGGQIQVFSMASKHQLLHKLTGFIEEKNLMRMSQGGKDGKYLAVTSEEGSVRIYNIKQEDEVLKLIGQSKKSINCVIWKDDQIYFACDAGNLECWGCKAVEQHKNGKKNGGKKENGVDRMPHHH